MMHYDKDYYKILQVHYLAEPEIIQSSYKRLARKYHPDVSGDEDSERTMQEINEAYAVLNDPQKRKTYHTAWIRTRSKQKAQQQNGEMPLKLKQKYLTGKAVLADYFDKLLHKEFEQAYDLITESDKQKVSIDEFVRWQKTVAKVYELKESQIALCKFHGNIIYNKVAHKDAIDLYVAVVEYNEITERYEKDYLVKTVVSENDDWRVLLGYEGLQPLIARFESLSELIKAKQIINELAETHSKTDFLTGLNNKKGFLEMAEREYKRYERYENIFSVILCGIGAEDEETIKIAGEVLSRNLRKVDLVGRWEASTFVVLVPETNLQQAIMVAKKLSSLLQKSLPISNISFGLEEFAHASILRCLEQATQYIDIAKNLKGSAIVSSKGII